MSALLIAFVAVLLMNGAYCLVALARDGWRRAAGPALLAVTSATVLIGGATALGRPKPSWLELPSGDVQILHVEMAEGRAIWVELVVPGRDEPMLYALPWNEDQAAKIHAAEERGKIAGAAVMMKSPFGLMNNGDYQPYPRPVQPLPPKGGVDD